MKLVTNFAKQLGIDKLNIISLMRNVYFCSKNNQAINVFPELCKLISIQIKNSKEYLVSNKISILKQPDYGETNTLVIQIVMQGMNF